MRIEVRKVPANWQHPTDEVGEFIPLFYRYDLALQNYSAGVEAIKAGMWYADSRNCPTWVSKDHPEAICQITLEDWLEEEPNPEHYMLKHPQESELTHWQFYEITTPGTPRSSLLKTAFELDQWVKENL